SPCPTPPRCLSPKRKRGMSICGIGIETRSLPFRPMSSPCEMYFRRFWRIRPRTICRKRPWSWSIFSDTLRVYSTHAPPASMELARFEAEPEQRRGQALGEDRGPDGDARGHRTQLVAHGAEGPRVAVRGQVVREREGGAAVEVGGAHLGVEA